MSKTSSRIGIIVLVIILLASVGYYALRQSGYLETFRLARQLQEQKQIQQQSTDQDQEVLKHLKSIFLLPEDVTPTMAVITDVSIVQKKDPQFFANAKNGDRLILYPNLAIIYDDKANKIIHIGPLQVTRSAPAAATSTSPQAPAPIHP